MKQNEIPKLSRQKFFNGQVLTDDDLTNLQQQPQELRWLHNRSLHGWGIAEGLEVKASRGDSEISVHPGFAIDCSGRELILSEAVKLQVPATVGTRFNEAERYFLIIRYRSDTEQQVLERRRGVCVPQSTVRLSNEPWIEWRRIEQVQEGFHIILAEAYVRNCVLDRPLGYRVRREVFSSHCSRIASGCIESEKLVWSVKAEGSFFIYVNTTSAFFKFTPFYTAQIIGSRQLARNGSVLAIISISEATASTFRLEILLPEVSKTINPASLRSIETGPAKLGELKWQINWFGTEE